MRPLLFSMLLLLSFQLYAKKAPKWRPGPMQVSPEGMRYNICKKGRGEKIYTGDIVRYHMYKYDYNTKTEINFANRTTGYIMATRKGLITVLDSKLSSNPIVMAIKHLKPGGKGFFVIPPNLMNDGSVDSSCYFIHVLEADEQIGYEHAVQDTSRSNSIDSVNIKITDPGIKNYGDTLFSVVKLVEVPQQTPCGISAVTVAFKFELTWFDKGTQHKNIVVFVDCPEQYGKDYFVKGASYVVTAIPMTENHKAGHKIMNSYSLEKLESYYGLRVKKMGG